jgi:tripartite-type tricarboxylate transporter receptor subunit TctC
MEEQMHKRRHFMALSAAALAMELPRVTRARTLDRPARLMVGFPAGSSPDFVARLLAEHLRDYSSTIVVDNRPGAGGRLPLEALKAAERDGSVMVLTPGDQVALFPHVYAKLGYDSERDLAPVSTVCTVHFILTVGPLVPPEVKTVADFVTWCRANPKHATYGSPGEGTRPHFMGTSFAREARLEMTHVPYKGGPPIVQDLLAGQIACSFTVVSNALSNVQSGQLRALAITAPRRSPVLPAVPTIREAGYPAAEGVEFFELFVPARTPEIIIAQLNAQIRNALQSQAFKEGLAKQGFDPAGGTPDDLRQLVRSDLSRWGAVVKQTEFKPID